MAIPRSHIAGLLGRHVDGPARVSLDSPIPLDRAFGIERRADGRVVLSDDSAAVLAHAKPEVRLGRRHLGRQRHGRAEARRAPLQRAGPR